MEMLRKIELEVEDYIVVKIYGWSECGVSDEEHRVVGKAMDVAGSVDCIWSEVVFTGEENTWHKSSDAGNIWNFGWATRELSKKC